MLRSVSEEVEQERRKKGIVDSAISTLSFTEHKAVIHKNERYFNETVT